MKKFASLVLALVLCMALTAPAMAKEQFFDGSSIPKGSYDGIGINDTVTISDRVTINSEETLSLSSGSTLIIGNGGFLKGSNCLLTASSGSKIILEGEGAINISFVARADANMFETLLNAGNIDYSRQGNAFKAGVAICEHKNLNIVCADCEEVISTYSAAGSTLSEGSLTIIVGIACLAIGFLVAMFIFKKKKPAVASGTDNTDEE